MQFAEVARLDFASALVGVGSSERCCLELVELSLGNRALVEQALGRGNLFCGVAPTSHLLNVGVGRRLRLLDLTRLTLCHPPASSDEIDQRGEEWEDDQSNHPKRLPPSAELLVTEQIAQ